ncbi:MAG: NAD(P)/FAD-dependent oxidoreductase [Deltaproteobacteria bacterium]|nr:NAD(P)/FAD-dependent oxidoreductase [Deltaproteobacteria bacterium]
MSTKWDTVVIGAGIGGLSAAARLVQDGLRVLILEKSCHPGGTAYVYTRKGFTFPMGPLGFSTPNLVRHALTDLDQGPDLLFSRVHYLVKAFGVEVPISLPFDQMKDELARRFPHDRIGINGFFNDMDKTLSALENPSAGSNRSALDKAETIPAQAFLKGLIGDWRLRRIVGSLGTHEPYSGLPLLAAMWGQMSKEGIWYPDGGMRAFCDRLTRAATGSGEHGKGYGKIRLGAEVKKIRLSRGRALGVTLADGLEIDTAAIVSNADYKATFMRLIDPQFLQRRWLEAVKRAKLTNSVFQVCLGIDTRKVDLSAFSGASRLIFKQTAPGDDRELSMNWLAENLNPASIAAQEMEISLWSKEDPKLAPHGSAVIVIRTEADHGHFLKYRPEPGKRIPAYHSFKIRLGQALISQAEQLVPGLEKAIQVFDVATPLTFEERAGRTEGAVAGWSWDFEDNPNQSMELVRTPISGLYMAGYQAYSALFMGGVPTALSSGLRAAESLLGGAEPIEQFRLPGD